MTKTRTVDVGYSEEDELKKLADVTARLGVLSQLQVHNLTIWSKAILGGSKITFCLGAESKTLEISSQEEPDFQGESLSLGLEYLDKCVRWMLGSFYRIQIICGGELIWDRNSKEWQTATSPQKNSPST